MCLAVSDVVNQNVSRIKVLDTTSLSTNWLVSPLALCCVETGLLVTLYLAHGAIGSELLGDLDIPSHLQELLNVTERMMFLTEHATIAAALGGIIDKHTCSVLPFFYLEFLLYSASALSDRNLLSALHSYTLMCIELAKSSHALFSLRWAARIGLARLLYIIDSLSDRTLESPGVECGFVFNRFVSSDIGPTFIRIGKLLRNDPSTDVTSLLQEASGTILATSC